MTKSAFSTFFLISILSLYNTLSHAMLTDAQKKRTADRTYDHNNLVVPVMATIAISAVLIPHIYRAVNHLTKPTPLYVCPYLEADEQCCGHATVDDGSIECVPSFLPLEHKIYPSDDESKEPVSYEKSHDCMYKFIKSETGFRYCGRLWMEATEFNKKIRNDFNFRIRMGKSECDLKHCPKKPKNIFPVKNRKKEKKCRWWYNGRKMYNGRKK